MKDKVTVQMKATIPQVLVKGITGDVRGPFVDGKGRIHVLSRASGDVLAVEKGRLVRYAESRSCNSLRQQSQQHLWSAGGGRSR